LIIYRLKYINALLPYFLGLNLSLTPPWGSCLFLVLIFYQIKVDLLIFNFNFITLLQNRKKKFPKTNSKLLIFSHPLSSTAIGYHQHASTVAQFLYYELDSTIILSSYNFSCHLKIQTHVRGKKRKEEQRKGETLPLCRVRCPTRVRVSVRHRHDTRITFYILDIISAYVFISVSCPVSVSVSVLHRGRETRPGKGETERTREEATSERQ